MASDILRQWKKIGMWPITINLEAWQSGLTQRFAKP